MSKDAVSLKPLQWTEPDPGLFRAVGYAIDLSRDSERVWNVWRIFKCEWFGMGTEKTLADAKRLCARHRITNRRL